MPSFITSQTFWDVVGTVPYLVISGTAYAQLILFHVHTRAIGLKAILISDLINPTPQNGI